MNHHFAHQHTVSASNVPSVGWMDGENPANQTTLRVLPEPSDSDPALPRLFQKIDFCLTSALTTARDLSLLLPQAEDSALRKVHALTADLKALIALFEKTNRLLLIPQQHGDHLISALIRLTQNIHYNYRIDCQFQHTGFLPVIPDEPPQQNRHTGFLPGIPDQQNQQLQHHAHEAVNNAFHRGASYIAIKLNYLDGLLTLFVIDNGAIPAALPPQPPGTLIDPSIPQTTAVATRSLINGHFQISYQL